MKVTSWTIAGFTGYFADWAMTRSLALLKTAALLSKPTLMQRAAKVQLVCDAMNTLSKPLAAVAVIWTGYVLARHYIEPAPYEAPPGLYPNGGPMIEITQEEARNKAHVFVCPAPLARLVQERVLMCERDPTLLQKVKSIASKWCDQNHVTNNQRYQAVAGALAASLTVPCIEQNVIHYAQSHAVQQQHGRLANYLSGIKHKSDPWWTKYLLIRR